MISVRRYQKNQESDWNAFVEGAANATFLLDRGFMDYHKDRFTDHSLLLFDKNELVSILPANEHNQMIVSHGGLTYGGLIVGKGIRLMTVLSCFYSLLRYYHHEQFTNISYKPVPAYFHTKPFFSDQYALYLIQAKLTAINTGFTADLRERPVVSSHHMRIIRKAQKNRVRIIRARDCRLFWREILVPHLTHKFKSKPVHSIEEIETLRIRFPDNILQYIAVMDAVPVAGVTIFWDRGVVHTQYIASSEEGRKFGALDYLCWHLLMHEFKNARFFSLGTTNMGSSSGRALSRGLVEWKERFGATMYPYACYDIETKNYPMLKAYS